MNCLQVDGRDSNISVLGFAYQVRTAILLAKTVNVIGNTGFMIFFEDYFNSLTHIRKIKLMVQASDGSEPEIIDSYEDYIKVHKDFTKIKHPPQSVFIAFKRMESTMEKMANEWKNTMLEGIAAVGLKGIFSFYEKGVFVPSSYSIDDERDDDIFKSKSKLITHQFPKETARKSVWMLPIAFCNFETFEQEIVFNLLPKERGEHYFIEAFNLPNVNQLSIIEIKSIKNQFSSPLQQLNEAIDNWATECYEGNGNEAFKNTIAPLFPIVKEIIDNNLILQHISSVHKNSLNHTIYFGEVSPVHLLKWHLLQNFITQEEYEDYLNQYQSKTPHTVPIMLFSGLNESDFERIKNAEIAEEFEVQSVKKFIDID
jgi:hypothetical protein